MRGLAASLVLVSAACISGRTPRERDERLLREVTRQQRWSQDALDRRPSADELTRVRNSDYEAVGSARKKLRRLLAAIDRGTWSREAIFQAVKDGDDDPELPRDFDRAGRFRSEAIEASDEVAAALADARGGLAIADLRPGFETVRKARESEQRLTSKDPRGSALLMSLRPAPLPAQRPFIGAAARVLRDHPEQQREVDRLPPEDAAQIRAQLADLERERAERPAVAKAPERKPPANEPAVQPAPSGIAEGPTDTLAIAGDAEALIARKGTPKAFVARPDGLFGLRYAEKRRCGSETCDEVDYLFDSGGKLVREEAVEKER